jgi:hypothetical protein
MKVCPPGNMGLFLRRPFHSGDARERIASWPVTLFLMLVSGFVTYELFSEWKAAQAIYLWAPHALAQSLGAGSHEGWLKGTWTLLVVPLAAWSVLAVPVVALRGASNVGQAWRRLALPLAVVIAAGHMAKGLAKFVSWGGYLPLALRQPSGTETALAIASGAMEKPHAFFSLQVVSVLSLVVLAVMACYSLRESRLSDAESHGSRLPSILLAALATGWLILGWGFLA